MLPPKPSRNYASCNNSRWHDKTFLSFLVGSVEVAPKAFGAAMGLDSAGDTPAATDHLLSLGWHNGYIPNQIIHPRFEFAAAFVLDEQPRFPQDFALSTGSESGEGLSPAGFFAFSGPPTTQLKRGKGKKDHESVDSLQTNNSATSRHYRICLLCASTHGASSCSTTGRRLSGRQHGGGARRPFQSLHRWLQYSSWLLFALCQHRRLLQHQC